jgi:O-acetyl-ADP-ribose deacetylase (regulator of RNase III)
MGWSGSLITTIHAGDTVSTAGEGWNMSEWIVRTVEYAGGHTFSVVVHDLLKEPVDCIVNAANGMLSHGGGVAAVIAKAAGVRLVEEGNALVGRYGPVPVGEAVVTTAGGLPFKGVVHAVGPRMGEGDEENKLVNALNSAFLRAHETGWESLSFPGVSSGIFSVPLDICARSYVRAVDGFFKNHPESPLKTIRLCLFEGPLLEAVKDELG